MTKERAQLTVRWISDPAELDGGSVDYRISVIAGEDVLTERVVSHRDHRFQQVVIGVDDFDDLEGNEKFDAIVQVAAVGLDEVAVAISEPFTLEFGETINHSLVRPARKCARSSKARLVSATANGLTSWCLGQRRPSVRSRTAKAISTGRVKPPPVGRASIAPGWCARWKRIGWREAARSGHWIQVVRADGSPIGPLQFVELESGDRNPTTERARDACRKLADELVLLGFSAV